MTKPRPLLIDAADRAEVEAYLADRFWIRGIYDLYRQTRLCGKYHPRLWRERQRRKRGREPAPVMVRGQ
jgi:hypothetical protein